MIGAQRALSAAAVDTGSAAEVNGVIQRGGAVRRGAIGAQLALFEAVDSVEGEAEDSVAPDRGAVRRGSIGWTEAQLA